MWFFHFIQNLPQILRSGIAQGIPTYYRICTKRLLNRANPEKFHPVVTPELEYLLGNAKYMKYASKKRPFKLSVGTEVRRCSHTVAMDVMYICAKPVIHIVDEATHFPQQNI